ncbi:MAG TPA: LPS assembly protein LptD [Pyrinomonadaceae bacterium]
MCRRAPARGAWPAVACALAACALFASARPHARAQTQTNPVERKVQNPISDTPNVNPLEQSQPVRVRPARQQPQGPRGASTEEFEIISEKQGAEGEEGKRVFLYEGNVDARVGVYRLQADKMTVYEATQRVVADGNVVFDQGDAQRITGTRAEFNYGTKLGFFVNSTGFTNQTEDGTIIYFTADRVERVAVNRIVATNAEITACDEENPKWSFTTERAEITINDRVRARRPAFRVKGVPVVPLPFVSVSIKRRDRASGFLTPTFSGSGKKGFRISNAYYQTLGRSADVTFRSDIYTGRGLGFGADVRTRANSRSYLFFGFYNVKDRIFGARADANNPDQGGSSFYADGVHYFPNGFLAAVDVNVTSNLAFRQVFSDNIQAAISPEERSQIFVNKNTDAYSFNFLARNQVTSLPNTRIRIRQLPGLHLDKRPSLIDDLKEKVPVYWSFEGGLEGVSRKETVEDLAEFQRQGNLNPLITPSVVQRLNVRPQVMLPLNFSGWSATATGVLHGTYYSNSIDPLTRLVVGRDLTRVYGEFNFDLRPPALARNFYNSEGRLRFRHVVEPYVVYRKIEGVANAERIIRFDYLDAVADTNEIEFGVTNRFFTRRSTETATGGEARANGAAATNGAGGAGGANGAEQSPLTSQPYEALSLTVRGKYFFDPLFGGALIPGRRNQFYPINTFSGFTYGGVPRRFSPLFFEARYRPNRVLSADVRTNLDTQGGGMRDLAVSFSLSKRLVQAFSTFYYTRAIELAPSLARFSDANGKEPGTQRGSQWSPTLFLGTQERGFFGGASLFFDFQNRPDNASLRSTTFTLGYTWDCCSVTVQDFYFNLGLRKENRVVFSFRLNGIGTFGTEQIGQQFR